LIFLFRDISERVIFRFGTHVSGIVQWDASGDPVGVVLTLYA
jgi:hypothetical protein